MSKLEFMILAWIGIYSNSSFARTHSSGPSVENTSNRELTVQAEYQQRTEPLTTEKISTLDPSQTYPHRQRWIIHRHVEITGLKAIPKPLGKFGVTASGIISVAQGYLRGPGPWYQSIQDFSCSSQPDSQFETAEGARLAAANAATLWSEVLEKEKLKLSFLLKQIIESSEEAALDQGDYIFRKWLNSLTPLWRAEVEQKGRATEWRDYLAEAKAEKVCPRASTSPPPPKLSWKAMMEPPATSPPARTQILARAPVKLWDDWYSVRLSVGAAGKTLNGRFLIDPGAKNSVISPTWLESQGIFPLWVIIPKETPGRVSWSGPWEGNGSLAPVAQVDSVSMSGLSLPLNRFLLKETEFYGPPDYLASCCDGVLGQDFLKIFPMEFQSTAPAEVRVWPLEKYRGPSNTQWYEIGEFAPKNLPTHGDFTYDIPHGRLWLTPAALKPTVLSNQSGLELEYNLENGERVLRVTRIRPRSKAALQLSKAGLKVGTQILQIDSKPVEDIDISEVEQRLAGKYGQVVNLQWKAGKGLKMAPLNLSASQ